MTTVETHTPSGLSDYVKDFLVQFKDKTGSYRYVEDIDTVSYTHLTLPTTPYV